MPSSKDLNRKSTLTHTTLKVKTVPLKEAPFQKSDRRKLEVKTAEMNQRSKIVLTKVIITKMKKLFTHNGTMSIFIIRLFLDPSKRRVSLFTVGTAPSCTFSTPIKTATSLATGSCQMFGPSICESGKKYRGYAYSTQNDGNWDGHYCNWYTGTRSWRKWPHKNRLQCN